MLLAYLLLSLSDFLLIVRVHQQLLVAIFFYQDEVAAEGGKNFQKLLPFLYEERPLGGGESPQELSRVFLI